MLPSNASAHVLPSGTTSMSVDGQSSTSESSLESQCCPTDCPIIVQSCVADAATGIACSGHGSCLSGTGVCRCFAGYTGDACDSCAAQYTPRNDSSNGVSTCVLLPGALSTCANGVRDGREVGVDCGGVCPPCVSGASSSTITLSVAASVPGTLTLVSFTIGTATILLLVGAGVLVWFRRRKASRRRGQHGRRVSTVCVTSAVYPHARAYDNGNSSHGTSDGNLDVSRRGSTDGARCEWTESQALVVVPVPVRVVPTTRTQTSGTTSKSGPNPTGPRVTSEARARGFRRASEGTTGSNGGAVPMSTSGGADNAWQEPVRVVAWGGHGHSAKVAPTPPSSRVVHVRRSVPLAVAQVGPLNSS